jgi:hypothetical protein
MSRVTLDSGTGKNREETGGKTYRSGPDKRQKGISVVLLVLASKAHEERRDVLLLLRARQEGFLGLHLFRTSSSNLLLHTLFNSSIHFIHKVLDRNASCSGGPQRRVFVRVASQFSIELLPGAELAAYPPGSSPSLQVRLDNEIVENVLAGKFVRHAVFLVRLSQRRPFGGGPARRSTVPSSGDPTYSGWGVWHGGFLRVRLNLD